MKKNKLFKNFRKMVNSNRMITVLILLLVQLLYFGFVCFSIYKEWYYATIVTFIVQVVVALTIISTERNSAYKIGWILLVFALPLFGCVFYLVYGLNISNKKLRKKIRIAKQENTPSNTSADTFNKLAEEIPSQLSFCEYLSKQGYPAYQNTSVKFFPNGQEFFADVIQNLKTAKKQIFIEMFIIEEGEIWDEMLSIIKQRAEQGVIVNIIYDDMGSIAKVRKRYYKKLSQIDNVECVKFNDVKPFLFNSINNRDHRKIIIIDDIAYTGGINIADEYANKVVRFGHWLDHGVRLCGEGANGVISMFMDIWNAFSPNKVQKDSLIAKPSLSDGIVQPFGTNPFNKTDIAYNVFLDAINRANKYIYISTPYFIPDNTLSLAIKHAAQRGVDVRILVPYIPDKKIPYRLTKANFRPLVKQGVKFYYYKQGFNHAKTFVSDDQLAFVGTANLDYISMFLNFECGVMLYNNSQIQEISSHFLSVFDQSILVDNQHLKQTAFGRFVDKLLVTIEMLF